MLEAIRRNSRSTIIYVLFAVLILVFVINFGPSSDKAGCGGALSTSFAARVSGSTISEQDYRLSYIALGGPNIPPAFARERHLKEFVMDKLIERELLAQEAERLGFSVSDKEVEDLLATGKMYILSIPRRADEFMADGAFDYKLFQRFVENRLGVNVQRFIEVQRREMLAEKVKQTMMGGVKITPEEAKADFVQRETQSNLEFVRFAPRQFEGELEVTPAEIADYQAKHADDIKKQYEDRSFLYKKVEKSVRARVILVALVKDEKDEAKVAAAQKKANRLRALASAKEFATVAKADSEDTTNKARGGDMGWRKIGFTGLPKEVEDKLLAAKAGEIIGPEKTERGFEILKIEGFREGDIPLEQVAPEIAEDKLRSDKGKAMAKAAAENAIKGHAADKTLGVEFPKSETKPEDAAKVVPATVAAEETGLFNKGGELVKGLGVSAEVMKAAFTLKAGELGGPYDIDNTWVVVRVKERKDADLKQFAEKKDDEMRRLGRQKWADVVEGYLKQRCVEARDAGRIKWNDEVLSYESSAEAPVPEQRYTPCGNRL